MGNNHQPGMNTDTVVYIKEHHFMFCLSGHQAPSFLVEIYTKYLKSESEISSTTNFQYPFQDKHEKNKPHDKRRHSTVIIYFSGRKVYDV